MAKIRITMLALALAFLSHNLQAAGQSPGDRGLDLKASMLGSAVTGNAFSCSQTQTVQLLVPPTAAKRAKLKAKLLNLLRESLYDDAKGIVNVAREKEISSLATKLNEQKEQ